MQQDFVILEHTTTTQNTVLDITSFIVLNDDIEFRVRSQTYYQSKYNTP